MQLEERMEENLMEILFQFLNSLKVTETAAMTIATYLGMNKENLITMINSIIKRYEQKGKVTEEELLKMAIMITCQKKKYSRNVDYAEGVLLFLIKSAYINKKEDETLFKTGNGQKTTPSNASSSIYSLLNKLQNVNNTDTKFSLDVDRFSNDLRIHTMYAKNKGNNDDTANAKALASTSETSVGNVPFNSSISKYSDNVKKFSLDVGRFSND